MGLQDCRGARIQFAHCGKAVTGSKEELPVRVRATIKERQQQAFLLPAISIQVPPAAAQATPPGVMHREQRTDGFVEDVLDEEGTVPDYRDRQLTKMHISGLAMSPVGVTYLTVSDDADIFE